MKLYVLGTGDAFAKNRKNTCFVLETDKKYLIDCPKEFIPTMDRNGIDASEIEGIILTHTHPDHLGDFETWFYKQLFQNYDSQNYSRFLKDFIENSKKISVYTSKEIFRDLKKKMDNAMTSIQSGSNLEKPSLEDCIDFIELSPEKPYQNKNGMEISVRDNLHPVPTIGLKIKYNGRLMSYSSDTEHDENKINKLKVKGEIDQKHWEDLMDFLWKPETPDLIIHEATSHKIQGHTWIKNLEELPEYIRSRLYIIHVPDKIETPFPVLEEGRVYEIVKGGVVARK